jgi:hypothetical protein
LTSLALSAAALLAVDCSPGVLRGVVVALSPVGVAPDAGFGVDGFAAGFAGDALAAEDTRLAVDFDAAALEAVDFEAVVDFAAVGLEAVEGFDDVDFDAAGLEAVDDFEAVEGFEAAGFDFAAVFPAAAFAPDVFVADARRFAAGLRVPAARPALPDAVRAVRVVPGVARPVFAPPARGPAVASVSFSPRRRRFPISEAPASTTLRPCSMAVSRMFFGVRGMR